MPAQTRQRFEPNEKLDILANKVIGAAIEVHRKLGPGLLESHYEAALCIELELRGIPYERQPIIGLEFKGRPIGECRLDVLVCGDLIVELKAVDKIAPIHEAQVISYLKATKKKLALLLNFNVPVLKDGVRRFVNS